MSVRFSSLFAVALLVFSTQLFASNSEAIDRENGVVYLTSIHPGFPEKFVVVRDGWEVDLYHYVDFGNGWELEDDRDYFEFTLDQIVFMGDNDRDDLIVAQGGYYDESLALYIPVLAYGMAGNDNLSGGQGSCELHGGDGVDNLLGTFGADLLDAGSDTVEGEILGLAGADVFIKWQAYLKNPQTGSYAYADYQVMDTDFNAAEGDEWLIRKKAMPNKAMIMNGGKIPTGPRPYVKQIDLSQLLLEQN